MSDATKLELVKNLPAIITAVGSAIAAILYVLIRKIDHIKELTNSNFSEVKKEVGEAKQENRELKTLITSTADARLRELEIENVRLKAERTTTVTSTSRPNGVPVPEPAPQPVLDGGTTKVIVANPKPVEMKISESSLESAVETVDAKREEKE